MRGGSAGLRQSPPVSAFRDRAPSAPEAAPPPRSGQQLVEQVPRVGGHGLEPPSGPPSSAEGGQNRAALGQQIQAIPRQGNTGEAEKQKQRRCAMGYGYVYQDRSQLSTPEQPEEAHWEDARMRVESPECPRTEMPG